MDLSLISMWVLVRDHFQSSPGTKGRGGWSPQWDTLQNRLLDWKETVLIKEDESLGTVWNTHRHQPTTHMIFTCHRICFWVRVHEGLFTVSCAVTQSDHWNPPTGPAQRSAVFRLTLWSNNWVKDSPRRRSRGAVFMVSGFQLKACGLSSREMPRAPVSSLPVVTSAVCPAHRGPS